MTENADYLVKVVCECLSSERTERGSWTRANNADETGRDCLNRQQQSEPQGS
jgi:hypothetical protein